MTLFLSPVGWIPPVARYGLALQERRELVGYRTQRDLVRAVAAIEEAGELPADLKGFSQQWLSTMETDRDGSSISGARPRQVRALAYMLRLSAEEFEQLVGVPIAKVPSWGGEDAAAQARPVARDDIQTQRTRPVPDSLKEAAALFGRHPEWSSIQEPRWVNFLAGLHHKVTPSTPEAWLELYLDLRKRFDPPELEN